MIQSFNRPSANAREVEQRLPIEIFAESLDVYEIRQEYHFDEAILAD